MLASQAVAAIVAAALVVQVALVGYLLFLTVAAALVAWSRRAPRPAGGGTQRRFAILVPAHNEEAVIERLLQSLDALDYPRDRFDVCVVADNCDDSTASIARRAGARVHERFATDERAKGFALRWLLQQLEREARDYDAFVIVDADSILAPNFLRAMDARLGSGARAVQAYYSVLNAQQSAIAGLRYAALAAVHFLRPLGRSTFGWSCGLKGNGMCFEAGTLREFTWRWFTLAEDVEFHLALVEHGIAVEFAPETWVKADMPLTLKQSASQNSRWEQGRLQLVRRYVPKLLIHGIRRRDWLQIDAALEQLIPPLSVPFGLAATSILAAWLVGAPGLAFVALGCLVGYTIYLLSALALVRAPVRIYLMLGVAPVYIAWKVSLYIRTMLGSRSTTWVRTARV
ncbi:MAG: glycosyltransferase [Chloroflexi bacterium]|nr:glycosyltransferase [Chloroflexota bacterium]